MVGVEPVAIAPPKLPLPLLHNPSVTTSILFEITSKSPNFLYIPFEITPPLDNPTFSLAGRYWFNKLATVVESINPALSTKYWESFWVKSAPCAPVICAIVLYYIFMLHSLLSPE